MLSRVNLAPQNVSKTPKRQYFRLSKAYFELGGFDLDIPARVFFLAVSIESFYRGYRAYLSRPALRELGFSRRTSDRLFREIESRGYSKCLNDGGKKRVTNLYQFSNELQVEADGLVLDCDESRAPRLLKLTLRQRFLFQYLTFRAVNEKRLRVVLKVPELVRVTGLSSGAIKIARKKFVSLGLLFPIGRAHSRTGNEYFLNPCLLHPSERPQFEDLDAVTDFDSDLFGASQFDSDLFGAVFGSFWRDTGRQFEPDSDLFGALSRSIKSLEEKPHGAERYILTNSPQGGENDRASNPEKEKKESTGQNQTPRKEGVALTRDEQLAYGSELKKIAHETVLGSRGMSDESQNEYRARVEALNQRFGKTSHFKPPPLVETEKTVGGVEEQKTRPAVVSIPSNFFLFKNKSAKGEVC